MSIQVSVGDAFIAYQSSPSELEQGVDSSTHRGLHDKFSLGKADDVRLRQWVGFFVTCCNVCSSSGSRGVDFVVFVGMGGMTL